MDNSPITGESDPQPKYPKCTSENPLETANLAFYSTNIVEGRGRGIVISCGDDTLIGKSNKNTLLIITMKLPKFIANIEPKMKPKTV